MKIFVNSEGGVTTSLIVDPHDKIYEVKNKVVDKGGALYCLRHLFFAGKEIDDGRTLLDYGVKDESVIRLDSSSNCLHEQGFPQIHKKLNGGSYRPEVQPATLRDQIERNHVRRDGTKVKQVTSRLASNCPETTEANLWNETVGEEGSKKFAEALQVNSHVLEINLYNNEIGPVGAAAIMGALCMNRMVEKLYFGSNNLGEDGLEALADMLCQNTSISALILREANIGGVGANILAVALCQNHTLRRVDLWNNQLGTPGCAALSTVLGVNLSLVSLCLSSNNICSKGGEILASALKRNRTLKRLDLGTNNIEEQGTRAVASALLHNTELSDLCLNGNNIGDGGTEALAGALCVNCSVARLDLRDNSITCKGTSALASALRHNVSLSKLVLHENKIADEGTKSLAQLLNVNRTISELYLCSNNISDEGGEALLRATYSNDSLFVLDLRGNAIRASLENKIRGLLRAKREQTISFIGDLSRVSSSNIDPVKKGRTSLVNALSLPDLGPVLISHQYIEFVTDNFSDENLIAEASFGRVFRGKDTDLGLNFVVKAFSCTQPDARGAHSIVEKEMKALRGFRHSNVARLSGYYLGKKSDEVSCLMYAVGSEGSLQEWLSCYKKRSRLHWATRISIALEVAVAVQSFVKSSKTCFLDVQANTITLSENYSPIIIPDLIEANGESARLETAQGKCDEEDIFSLGIVFSELLMGVQQNFRGSFASFTDTCAGDWVECLKADFTRLIRDCVAPSSGTCPLIEDVFYRLRILAAKALPYSWERSNHLTVLCSAPLCYHDSEGNLSPIQNGLDFDSEKRLLLDCIRDANEGISLTFDVATFERLQVAIARRSRCLHFSGHGYPNRLLFEDDLGGAHFLDGDELRDCVHTQPCQFVFVSACFSEYMGKALVKAGVQHVLCCSHDSEFEDRAAIEFTHIFYFSVFKGFTIADAFQKGKQRVNAKFGNIEASKFLLLPQSADHDVPLFAGEKRGEILRVEREYFTPSVANATLPQQEDIYKLLQRVLSHRLVAVVGGKASERSSLASAVCKFINDRKSIFLCVQSIHYIQHRLAAMDGQRGFTFIKSLYFQLLAKGRERTAQRCVDKDMAVSVVSSLIGSPSLIVFDECFIDDTLTDFIGQVLELTGTVKFLVTCQEGLKKCLQAESSVFQLDH